MIAIDKQVNKTQRSGDQLSVHVSNKKVRHNWDVEVVKSAELVDDLSEALTDKANIPLVYQNFLLQMF